MAFFLFFFILKQLLTTKYAFIVCLSSENYFGHAIPRKYEKEKKIKLNQPKQRESTNAVRFATL